MICSEDLASIKSSLIATSCRGTNRNRATVQSFMSLPYLFPKLITYQEKTTLSHLCDTSFIDSPYTYNLQLIPIMKACAAPDSFFPPLFVRFNVLENTSTFKRRITITVTIKGGPISIEVLRVLEFNVEKQDILTE